MLILSSIWVLSFFNIHFQIEPQFLLFFWLIWRLTLKMVHLGQNFGLSTHQRSAIFYTKEGERKEAQESKIRRQMRMNKRIVTKILAVGNSEFFLAENQHQKYYLQKYHRLCGSLELRSTHQFVESTIACKLNGYFITLNFHQLQFTNYLSHCFLALLYCSFWSIFLNKKVNYSMQAWYMYFILKIRRI